MIEWWGRRGGRSWFCLRSSFLSPARSTLLKLTTFLSHRTKGNADGLVVLYKDMESCAEYSDIRVLWEMVQSSQSLNYETRRAAKKSWGFCFGPY
ncbi:hypothetical protein SAY86_000759 [Trapa natans]|uniref:Uncharacterized protein n=1 Tax=Trapa natans TaxID=22666 RepID=A0AAN7MFJ1_TRANT|nr:hypothetical protein SAY86_000759 [Trapa natans]